MATNPETEQRFKVALSKPELIAAAQKKIEPILKDLTAKVPNAIKAGDRPMIQSYLKALKVLTNLIGNSVDDVAVGLGTLGVAEDDEDFIAEHLKESEDATKSLTAAKTLLAQQYETAKGLEHDATEALKSKQETKEDFIEEIARFDKWIVSDLKTLTDLEDKIEEPIEEAEEAVERRDAKALAAAQKAVKDLYVSDAMGVFGDRQTSLQKLLKSIQDRKFDAKTTADLKGDIDDLLARINKVKDEVKGMLDAEKEVLGYQIEEIDVKKAVKALGMDAKAEAKLSKALKSGSPAAIEKALDALAKELKMKTTGKALYAELRKAKIV